MTEDYKHPSNSVVSEPYSVSETVFLRVQFGRHRKNRTAREGVKK